MFSVFSLKSKLLLYHVAYYPKIRKIFPKKFGHHGWRGRATPIFLPKIKVWFFSKFLQHRVADDRATPIFSKN